MPFCLITGDVNLDHLDKAEWSKFFHYNLTISLFISDKYLVGKYLRLCKYSVFHHTFHLLILASIIFD